MPSELLQVSWKHTAELVWLLLLPYLADMLWCICSVRGQEGKRESQSFHCGVFQKHYVTNIKHLSILFQKHLLLW